MVAMSYFCRQNVSQISLEIVANCSHPSEILALAFVTVPKSRVLPQMAIRVLFTPAGRLRSLHICAGIVTGQWRDYTYAQAYLSLRHCTKISRAASDGDFCSIHPRAKTGESAHLCRCSYWTMQ